MLSPIFRFFGPRSPRTALALLVSLALQLPSPASAAKELRDIDRERGLKMLEVVRKDIEKNHLDPTFGGKDMEPHFQAAAEKIKVAKDWDAMFEAIGLALMEMDDSHTFFQPPPRNVVIEWGFNWKMIGPRCLITAVKPKSDAEAKGLKPGDIILSINGIVPTRNTLWKIDYTYGQLDLRIGVRLGVKTGTDAPRTLDVSFKAQRLPNQVTGFNRFLFIREAKDYWNLQKHRYYEIKDQALVWHMKAFDLDDKGLDKLNKSARDRKALILDLRGNPGGGEEVMTKLMGSVFDRNITVGQAKMREKTEALVAKSWGKKAFKGLLIVLLDSDSGSAAEVFAKVVQLEKRGTVIGDRSAGAVMGSRFFSHTMGGDLTMDYGVSVTLKDLIMNDRASLEKVGVKPDEVILPTPEDLAAGRDPALARAMELAGVPISPEQAGTLFPAEWGP